MNTIMNRIEARLEALGITRAEAERRSGSYRGMIHQIGAGKSRMPSADRIQRLAEALSCDVEYLMGQQPEVKKIAGARQVSTSAIPIAGKVEAGRFITADDFFDEANAEMIEAPRHHRFQGAKHCAFEVQGDSMTEVGILHGDYVIAVAWDDTGYMPISGMIVIVEQSRNGGHLIERTVKEVEVRRDGIALIPRSKNPIHKEIFLPKSHADDGKIAHVVGLVYHVSRPIALRF